MQINKIHTAQKAEESSSLKNQGILFIRRPDITSDIRLDLGIAGLNPQNRNCTIAELCAKYKVSHEFIYGLSRLLRKAKDKVFGLSSPEPLNDLDKVLESMRFFIEARIETQGSLQGLSNLGSSWGGAYKSTNFISQSLEVAGSLLPNSLTY